jgi:hypothetical protein
VKLDVGHQGNKVITIVRDENEFLINEVVEELTILQSFPATVRNVVRFEPRSLAANTRAGDRHSSTRNFIQVDHPILLFL